MHICSSSNYKSSFICSNYFVSWGCIYCVISFLLLNFENISLKHHPSKLNRLSFKRCSENPSHCHFHLMYLATSEFLFKVTSKIYSLKSLKDLKRLSENFYRRSMDLKKLQALSS